MRKWQISYLVQFSAQLDTNFPHFIITRRLISVFILSEAFNIYKNSYSNMKNTHLLQDSSEGWRMIQLRLSLPAYKERDAILNAISQNQV